jgi:hypothetical protein
MQNKRLLTEWPFRENQPMRKATEPTPTSAKGRGWSVLVDLLVMACTGASIAWYAHREPQGKLADMNSLASLVTFTSIAVLVGTLFLQLVHHGLTRKSRNAASSQPIKALTPPSHMNAHSSRRARSTTKARPRSGSVRFSGRS